MRTVFSAKAAAPPGAPRDARQSEFYDASFDATWELDLFGSRPDVPCKPPTPGFAASEATRLDVLVSVTAEVARNYFELRGLQNQLAVARKNADVQTETLKDYAVTPRRRTRHGLRCFAQSFAA